MHLLSSMLFWIVARIQVDILMLLVQELFILDFCIEGLDEVELQAGQFRCRQSDYAVCIYLGLFQWRIQTVITATSVYLWREIKMNEFIREFWTGVL